VFAIDAKIKAPTPHLACLKYKLKGKWEYTITKLEGCPSFRSFKGKVSLIRSADGKVAADAMYENVRCCTKDKCNAPDPGLDPTTKIIPTPPGLAEP
jgi:hypothetical protein